MEGSGIIAPTPWLPPDAICTERLQPLLAAVVAEWCEHWFAKTCARISPMLQDNCPSLRPEAMTRALPQGLSVTIAGEGTSVLAGALLSTSVPKNGIQQSDQIVLDHLAGTCITDLVERFQGLTAGERKPVATPLGGDVDVLSRWEICLTGGRRVLTLALSTSFAVSLVRRTLKPVRQAPVHPVRDAIRNEQVRVAANVGRCTISFADVRELAPGDVLVLHQSQDVPVPLVVNGSPFSLRATLETSEANASLRIVAEEKVDV